MVFRNVQTKMASLVKLRRIINPLTSKNTGLLYNVVRSKVYIHDDWKPGPYPKTEEERRKAAEKYGLSPEEYEPYPDDGCGYGDYPKLPFKGAATRDPFYPWDDPANRRNFCEPLHVDHNILGQDRLDVAKPPVPTGFALRMFFGTLTFFAVGMYLWEPYGWHHPVMEKQVPRPGVVHYTFEPAR